MTLGIICILITLVILSIYLLIPLPILSYNQSTAEVDVGNVTKIKTIRPGVIEIALTQGLNIDSKLQEGGARMTGATCTRFFYLRKWHSLPKLGDKISVESVNRLHLFTGRSFNWVKIWNHFTDNIPSAGSVRLITS